MIILIKVGQNEPDTYLKADRLYKHGDIVDVLPRHPPLGDDYSPGVKAEKEFFIVKIDSSQMTDKEFNDMRDSLLQPILNPDKTILKRRAYFMDLANTSILNSQEKSFLSNEISKKDSKSAYDLTTINKLNTNITLVELNNSVKSKEDNKSIAEVALKKV